MRRCAWLVAALLAPVVVNAGECTARSGAQTTALVELYTSEGCDSCPPADKWLAALPGIFDAARVVPLAYHVDYWDDIGWKDPFAIPSHAARQYKGVRISGGYVVYTPQVMLNGVDFPTWEDKAPFRKALVSANAQASRADLALSVKASDREAIVSIEALLRNSDEGADTALYLAVTESRLESRVKAGENKGVTLRHDQVVRELRALDRFASPKLSATQRVSLAPGWKRNDVGFTAFVQNTRTGEILQALALPLCPT